MSVRQKTHTALNVPTLTNLLPGGLHAGGSLTGPPSARPWAVYRVQNINPALRGDDNTQAKDTVLEVWVYDDPGTFTRIEAALDVVEVLIVGSAELRCRYIGTSNELPDDELKAIFKNISFQVGELA